MNTHTKDTIDFRVTTPHGVVYKDYVEEVRVPTTAGRIVVLNNHTPLLSVLTSGEMSIRKGGEQYDFALSGGVLDVRRHRKDAPGIVVNVLADTSERAEEIDIERAEEARKRAEDALKEQNNMSDVDFARFQSLLDRQLTRLTVARRRQYRK